MGDGEIIDHGGGGGGGHGGHGEGGGGRPHEYYHPKTRDEYRIAWEWNHFNQRKAELETLMVSLQKQGPDWVGHYEGQKGLARGSPEGGPKKPPIRTPRLTSPTPYDESYFKLGKDIARLNRLHPGDPEIDKIRHKNNGAYLLWQSYRTRGQRFGNLLWSLSARGGLEVVAKGWERITKPFGPLGRILNWPVKTVVGLITHLFGEFPTGPHDLAKPGSPQFKVSQLGVMNVPYADYKIEEYHRLVEKTTNDLDEVNNSLAAIAQQHEWVHRLPHASGGH